MPAMGSPRSGAALMTAIGWLALSLLPACAADPIEVAGQFGRPLALVSGDNSRLPRLAFVDQGCPGEAAVGGCPTEDCQTLLVDSLAPLTAIRQPDASGSRLSIECLEVRPGRDLLDDELDAEQRAAAEADAVARFRFDNLPVVRTPDDDAWSWTAGDQAAAVEPAGVLGGNLLRNFAVAIRNPPPRRPVPGSDDAPSDDEPIPTLTLYGEFPGSEGILADQGRAFLPLQFPGRLLGREPTDRCEVDQGSCEIDGFDISTSQSEIPLAASRMVMDACLAVPPCGLRYEPSSTDPFGPGTCSLHRGPSPPACVDSEGNAQAICCDESTDPEFGGVPASLVIATSVPGLVLFSDSATRMFGDLDALTPCPEPLSPNTELIGVNRACRIADGGQLHFAGWPSAGLDAPLTQLRIRSLALVPGAERSSAAGPCERTDQRLFAAYLQCDRYRRSARSTGDIRDAAPPYSAQRDDADGQSHIEDPGVPSLAVLGEATLQPGAQNPRPARWIRATVLPADHPLALAIRRDLTPDALQPDGLLGTALLAGNEVVLDYTDLNPALRVACLAPHTGRCQVLPDCREDRRAACCHGLPLTMLDEFIRILDDDTCCGALSADELEEIQQAGHCAGVLPP